jgi:YD repeat-containing protein
MNRTVRLIRCVALCLSVSFTAKAQDYLNAVGNPSFSVNIPVENGYINVTNGNLHLEFPLATHKQRGALQLNERLVYDSRIWRIEHYSGYYWWPINVPNNLPTQNVQAGWRFVTGNETGNLVVLYGTSQVVSSGCPAPPYDGQETVTTSTLAWNDPTGTLHTFTGSLTTDQNDCTFSYIQHVNPGYAADASGYQLQDDGSGNPIVLDNNGTRVYPQVTDRYGNYWSTDSSGNLIDDLGRTPVIVTKNGNVTYYDVLAPNGPINNNGTRVRYTVTTAQVTVRTYFLQSGVTEWPNTGFVGYLYPVQSIQLPDGTSYSFTYDSFGEMTSMTLPTGGVIHYG